MAEEQKTGKGPLCCPYCEGELAELAFPYCGTCQVQVFYCPGCREPVSRDVRVCPSCGTEIKGEKAETS